VVSDTAAVRSNLLSNQAGPERKANQSRNVINIQALHQLGTMVFDGFGADIQQRANSFRVLALGNELQNFALARGQLLERTFRLSNLFERKFLPQSDRDFAAEVDLAICNAQQSSFEFRRPSFFQQVARRA